MRDMIWVPGIEVEEDEMYGAHMPTDIPTDLKVPERVADDQCERLNKHLRSCSQNEEGNHYSRSTGGGEDIIKGSCSTSLEDLGIPGLCDT